MSKEKDLHTLKWNLILAAYTGFAILCTTLSALALTGADVALYNDQLSAAPLNQRGTWAEGATAIKNFLAWKGLTCEEISYADLNLSAQDFNALYKLLLVPGGYAQWYNYWISQAGKTRIRSFVSNGGGYFGICAGAFFACDVTIWEGIPYDDDEGLNAWGESAGYDLDLFAGTGTGPMNEIADWETEGYNMTSLLFPEDTPVLSDYQSAPFTESILYYGGPFFSNRGTAPFHCLAEYEYNAQPAAIAFHYGSGRVVLMGPHPEIEEDDSRDGVTIDREDSMDDAGSDWDLFSHAIDWQLDLQTPTPTPVSQPTPTPNWKIGSIRAQGDSAMAGMVLYGNKISRGMAGMPAATQAHTDHVLCHFQSNTDWFTGVAVANTSQTAQAHVDLVAYNNEGAVLSTTQITLAPSAKASQFVTTLFGDGIGQGWISVTSDTPVVAFDVYGHRTRGGLSALPSSPLRTELVFSHFHCDSVWWTGIALVNPNGSEVTVDLTARDVTGTVLDTDTVQIAAMGKLVGMADSLLSVAGKSGWIEASVTGGSIAGMLVYGKSGEGPMEMAALPAVGSLSDLCLTNAYSAANWWTGVAVVNPGSASTNVDLSFYAPNGVLVDQATRTLQAKEKMLGLVKDLFTLAGHQEGWIRVNAADPVVGLEVIHADDDALTSWGLAGVAAQRTGQSLYLSHYDVTDRWWTFLSIANLSGNPSLSPLTQAYCNEGIFAGKASPVILLHGRLDQSVDQLIPLP